jgi:hypothetical protein
MTTARKTVGLAAIGVLMVSASTPWVRTVLGDHRYSDGGWSGALGTRAVAPVFSEVGSREFSVGNRAAAALNITDIVSREFSVNNRLQASLGITDVVSREFSVHNRLEAPLEITDVISREFSVRNEPPPFLAFNDVVSREFSVYAPAPDLQVTALSAPAEVQPGQPFTVAFSIANAGDAPATGTWVDRVYLSDDDVLGGDTLLRAYLVDGPLEVGETYSRVEVFDFASTPGDYTVFVVANSDVDLDEGDNGNNNMASTPVASTGIDYGATVQASIETGPEGTPVILSGEAFWLDTSEPAPNVEVTVRVRLQDTRRIYSQVTDDNGLYAFVFDPLPGEAGHYTVFADHPLVSEDPASPQDEFTIYGLRSEPDQRYHRVAPGSLLSDEVTLRNLGDTPLTGISAVVNGAPANLDVQITAPDTLAPLGTATLSYTLDAADGTVNQSVVQVELSSAEGAVESLALLVDIAPEQPQLTASPSSLEAGMVRGGQNFVEFTVTNTGGAPTGALDVQLPAAEWLSLVTETPLEPLEVNESTTVTLRLSPADDLPLGPYPGNLLITGPVAGLSVPFVFTAISTATGDLQVYATDELTYWAPDTPPVEGAAITVRDPFTGDVVATGITDVNGLALFQDLTEAHYEIEAVKEGHGTARVTALVAGGGITQVETFMTRQLVNYQWSVFPTTIEDEYLITLEAVFETFVPAPVVTIEPASVDLRLMQDETMQVDFTITNHGLITADDVGLNIGLHPRYELTPLVSEIGDLPAQQFVVVPVIIRDTEFGAGGRKRGERSACVGIRFETVYTLVCGVRRSYSVPVIFGIPGGDCGGVGGGGYVWPGYGGGEGGGITVGMPEFGAPVPCGPCTGLECPTSIFSCALGFGPAGCPLGLAQNCGVGYSSQCLIAAVKACLVGQINPMLGAAVNLMDCLRDIPCACNCDSEDPNCPPRRFRAGGVFDPLIIGPADPPSHRPGL